MSQQYLTMPNLGAAFLQSGNAPPSNEWARLFRELLDEVAANRCPGRLGDFKIAAADILDPAQFVQSGVTAGLGVGIRRGWAICNGNNGTDDWSNRFPRINLLGGSGVGGSDSSAHDHPAGTLQADINISLGDAKIYQKAYVGSFTSDKEGVLTSAVASAVSQNRATAIEGSTGAASSTDNKPLYMDCVRMMRI